METEKKTHECEETVEETVEEETVEEESKTGEDENGNDEECNENLDDNVDTEDLEVTKSKIKPYILGGIILIVAVVIYLAFLFPSGNNNNENATPEEKFVTESKDFKSIAESYGYIVKDLTEEIPVDGATTILCALEKDENYQIEYFIFKDTESAKAYYNNCKLELEELASFEEKDGTEPETIDNDDYQKFTLTTKESLLTVIRKNDTILYVNYNIQYKEESAAFLNEIGGY